MVGYTLGFQPQTWFAWWHKNRTKMWINWKWALLSIFSLSVLCFCLQIASLPGRFDQIDHLLRPESSNIRSISPISILRDSRPVSPLVFNSNHSSPATTPYPSPEHHPPSTPPIRLEDFSPVKSEDDTGIHSGSSESDHEVRGGGRRYMREIESGEAGGDTYCRRFLFCCDLCNINSPKLKAHE